MAQKPTAAIADRDPKFSQLLSNQLSGLGITIFHADLDTSQDIDRILKTTHLLFVDASESPSRWISLLNTSVTVIVMGWDQELASTLKDLGDNVRWMWKAEVQNPSVLQSLIRVRQSR